MNTSEAYFRLRQVEKAIRSSFADGRFLIAPQDIEMENERDPEERQLHDELHTALYHLDNVCSILSYYDRPVVAEGVLYRNANGRYELDGHELTSGQTIELMVYDPDWDKAPHWVRTKIECDSDYYAVYQHMSLEGKQARIR